MLETRESRTHHLFYVNEPKALQFFAGPLTYWRLFSRTRHLIFIKYGGVFLESLCAEMTLYLKSIGQEFERILRMCPVVQLLGTS